MDAAAKPERLHAEAVQADASVGERGDQVGDLAGGLPPANRAETDDSLAGEVDAHRGVGVGVLVVC